MKFNSYVNEGGREKLGYSVSETACKLGLSEKTIYRQIKIGNLRTCKYFRKKMIPARDVNEYYEKNSEAESF